MHSGFIIRSLREADGLMQQDLADRLHVSRTYLSQLETGKREPSIQLLKNAAGIFGVPVALLLIEGSREHVSILNQLQQVLTHVLEAKRRNRIQAAAKAASPPPTAHPNT